MSKLDSNRTRLSDVADTSYDGILILRSGETVLAVDAINIPDVEVRINDSGAFIDPDESGRELYLYTIPDNDSIMNIYDRFNVDSDRSITSDDINYGGVSADDLPLFKKVSEKSILEKNSVIFGTVDQLVDETNKIESIISSGDAEELYSLTYNEFSNRFPAFTSNCVDNYLNFYNVHLDDKEKNEYWSRGELVIKEDFDKLILGAKRLCESPDIEINWDTVLSDLDSQVKESLIQYRFFGG